MTFGWFVVMGMYGVVCYGVGVYVSRREQERERIELEERVERLEHPMMVLTPEPRECEARWHT